jgi:magnesium chelatase family protein
MPRIQSKAKLVCVQWYTNGILPMASLAKEKGFRSVFVPAHDAPEAALIPNLDIYPAESLNQIASHFAGGPRIAPM